MAVLTPKPAHASVFQAQRQVAENSHNRRLDCGVRWSWIGGGGGGCSTGLRPEGGAARQSQDRKPGSATVPWQGQQFFILRNVEPVLVPHTRIFTWPTALPARSLRGATMKEKLLATCLPQVSQSGSPDPCSSQCINFHPTPTPPGPIKPHRRASAQSAAQGLPGRPVRAL